jgi:hypothetical protein
MEKGKRHVDLVRPTSGEVVAHHGAPSTEETNLYRRNLLKLIAVGGGAFLVGRLSGPVADYFVGDKVLSMKDFKDFKFVETTRELKMLDKNGGEILIVDKDAIGG